MQLLVKQWFLLLLFAALGVGFWMGGRLEFFSGSVAIRNAIVFVVMYVMAWTLEFHALQDAVRRPAAMLLACGLNLGLFPLLVAGCLWFFDPSIAAGFVVVAAIPTTLASAAVWTRKGGGNDAVAMMVTVVTNAPCFLVTPFLIWLILGDFGEIDPVTMIIRLILLVLLPMVLGQVSRTIRPLREFAGQQRVQLSVLAQLGVLSMVVIGAANTQIRIADGEEMLTVGSVFAMIGLAVGLHLVLLLLGYFLSMLLNLGEGNAIAVAIAGSQKTMMVGLLVCDDLGISIVPMVIYHTTQLIIDTAFVNWTAGRKTPDPENDPED